MGDAFLDQETAPLGWGLSCIGKEVEFTRKPRDLDVLRRDAVPFIPMDLLPDDGLYTNTCETRHTSELTSGVFFYNGDILLAKITPCLENGKQAIARGIPGGWGFATTEVFPLRARRLDTEFLAFFLRVKEVRRILATKMQGATGRQRLPREALESFPVPVPPLAEQRAIARVLRTVQQAKEATERVVAAARQLKQSLMRHLFTYGPTPFDRADRVALKDTEVGPMPEHWHVASLGEASEFLQYGTSSRCDGDTAGMPVLRIPNVIGDVIDTEELKYLKADTGEVNRLRLSSGDLLFVRTNGRKEYIGRCAVYKGRPESALFASYLIRARLRAEKVLPDFFQMYSTTESGRGFLSGRASSASDGKFNINTQILRGVMLPRPPVTEQLRIVRMVEAVNAAIEAHHKRMLALENLFQSLLHNLMIGKVRVSAMGGGP